MKLNENAVIIQLFQGTENRIIENIKKYLRETELERLVNDPDFLNQIDFILNPLRELHSCFSNELSGQYTTASAGEVLLSRKNWN